MSSLEHVGELPEWVGETAAGGSLELIGDEAATLGWSRGYATEPGGNTLVDAEIIQWLSQEPDHLESRAAELNGCFSAVLRRPSESAVVTDRFGTIPLYLVRRPDRSLAIAVDVRSSIEAAGPSYEIDQIAVLDLLQTGYVVGERTLLHGVRTLSPASVTRYTSEGVRVSRYWSYGYQPEALREVDLV